MAIPLSLLWGTQMKSRTKFALAGIFSFAIITMVFSIVRTVAVTTLTLLPDTSWVYMWSAIETTVDQPLVTLRMTV